MDLLTIRYDTILSCYYFVVVYADDIVLFSCFHQ